MTTVHDPDLVGEPGSTASGGDAQDQDSDDNERDGKFSGHGLELLLGKLRNE